MDSIRDLQEVLDAIKDRGTDLSYDSEMDVWVSVCPLCAAGGEPGPMSIYGRTVAPVAVMMCCDTKRDEHRAYDIATEMGIRPWFVEAIEQARMDIAQVIKAIDARGIKRSESGRIPNQHGMADRHQVRCPICIRNNQNSVIDLYIDDDDQPDGDGDQYGQIHMACRDADHSEAEIATALGALTKAALVESYGAINWDDGPAGTGDWLDEPLIERGQFTSIYGPAGIGKSLLAQERAARLARDGYRVLYLDAENPMTEVRARLQDMNYTAADLANLVYLSFPDLPPLDAEEGAARLGRIVDGVRPDLVVLDTWSKFIGGDEASPSTHTAAYNLSIVPLRRRGVAVQSIDHSGKEPGRGPRGGSSKVDNVDTLWLVTAKAGGQLRLERRKSRTGRGPDLVELVRRVTPLRHDRVDLSPDDVLGPEVRACVAKLDDLDVPTGWGRGRVEELLKDNDYRVRTATLSAAIRTRKDRGHTAAGPGEAPS